MIQIQDNGTGIRVSKTSEEQAICVLCGVYLTGSDRAFPCSGNSGLLWMGYLTQIFSTDDKYIWNTYSKLDTIQENKVKERVMRLLKG